VLARLASVGHYVTWCTSVEAYRAWLAGIDVPLRRNAALIAAHHDARVAAEIARAEAKRDAPQRAARVSQPKPSAGRLRKIAAVRGRVMF
jgi:hypothetical protein